MNDPFVTEQELLSLRCLPTRCTDCGRKLTLREAQEGYGVCDACWREQIEIQETGDGGDAVGAGVRW